jgi:hypothetical protein
MHSSMDTFKKNIAISQQNNPLISFAQCARSRCIFTRLDSGYRGLRWTHRGTDSTGSFEAREEMMHRTLCRTRFN